MKLTLEKYFADINSIEAIVSMLVTTGVKKRLTTVTIYDVCQNKDCEDTASVIRRSLDPHAVSQYPRYFLVLGQGKTIRKVVEQVLLLTFIYTLKLQIYMLFINAIFFLTDI